MVSSAKKSAIQKKPPSPTKNIGEEEPEQSSMGIPAMPIPTPDAG